jgi:hypothetical protein
MECPHCKETLKVEPYVYRNLETYHIGGGLVKATTDCCGNIVSMSVQTVFKAYIPYNHNELTEDDWGNKKKC